jgi:hypothetical protein
MYLQIKVWVSTFKGWKTISCPNGGDIQAPLVLYCIAVLFLTGSYSLGMRGREDCAKLHCQQSLQHGFFCSVTSTRAPPTQKQHQCGTWNLHTWLAYTPRYMLCSNNKEKSPRKLEPPLRRNSSLDSVKSLFSTSCFSVNALV